MSATLLFGVAISAALFTALSADSAPVNWIAGADTVVPQLGMIAIAIDFGAPSVDAARWAGDRLVLCEGTSLAVLRRMP